jgi:hypothetical protein
MIRKTKNRASGKIHSNDKILNVARKVLRIEAEAVHALIKKLNSSGYPLRAIRELFMEGRTDLKGNKQ